MRPLQALMAVAAALPLTACDWNSHADAEATVSLHQVDLVPVSIQGSYAIQREYAGQVEASQNPTVAFELSGRIRDLRVDDGDLVRAGQSLAQLDTRLLEAERDELEARTREVEAERDLARRDLARIERLITDQLASERERDELASRVRLLEATLARHRAASEANAIRLEKSALLAPFDARIQRREADQGAVVAAGAPVFTLVAIGRREVRTGLPVAVADNLSVGEEIPVRIGADLAHGKVVAIGAVVDQGTRSQVVRLFVERDWPPGELAYLRVTAHEPQDGAWLPDTSVTEGLRGTWVCYVAVPRGDGEAVLEARGITVHHAADGRLFVSGALADGEHVVATGLHRVAPGQVVRSQRNRNLAATDQGHAVEQP